MGDSIAGLLGAVFVHRLRLRHGLESAAAKVGLSARTLQRIEKGESTPRPETLALLGETAGFSRRLVERLQTQLEAHELAEAGGLAGDPASSRRSFADEILAVALEAIETAAESIAVELAPAPWEETGNPRPEDRRRADELWRRFAGFKNREDAYRLVRESSAFRIWSFAERLAHESEAVAADSPAEALNLARLAVEIARGTRGTAGWRARVEAYTLSFYGNAHSACKDLDQARAAFAQARKLRSAFSANDPRWLDESRLPDGAMPDPRLA